MTADTYFPAVTNISSRHLEKMTVVAFPTLRPAAGLTDGLSLNYAPDHHTARTKGQRESGGNGLQIRNGSFSRSRRKEIQEVTHKGMKNYIDQPPQPRTSKSLAKIKRF